jgi:hypothetical protein
MVTLGGIMGAKLARVWFGDRDAHAIRVMSLAGGGAALSAFFSVWKSTTGLGGPTKLQNSLARSNRSRFG